MKRLGMSDVASAARRRALGARLESRALAERLRDARPAAEVEAAKSSDAPTLDGDAPSGAEAQGTSESEALSKVAWSRSVRGRAAANHAHAGAYKDAFRLAKQAADHLAEELAAERERRAETLRELARERDSSADARRARDRALGELREVRRILTEAVRAPTDHASSEGDGS